jgi:ribosomal protein S18 acetylase RimI-like enzyme
MTEIVEIKTTDLKECAELYVKVFNRKPWNDLWIMDTAQQRLSDIFKTPNFIGLSYQNDGKIQGAVFGNCEQWYQGAYYNLKEMFVDPEVQGKKIGSRLVKELEERLNQFRIQSIILYTSRENGTNEFYAKNGFETMGSMEMMAKNFDKK